MTPTSPETTPVRPLLSPEEMERILSARRSISSDEAYQQIAVHLGRPLSPGKRLVLSNGREVWVSN